MTDIPGMAIMFAAGAALAAAWLVGLWIDVRALARAPRSGVRLLLGALLRLSVVAAGLYLVVSSDPRWTHILAAVAGFAAVRALVLGRVRNRVAPCAREDRS